MISELRQRLDTEDGKELSWSRAKSESGDDSWQSVLLPSHTNSLSLSVSCSRARASVAISLRASGAAIHLMRGTLDSSATEGGRLINAIAISCELLPWRAAPSTSTTTMEWRKRPAWGACVSCSPIPCTCRLPSTANYSARCSLTSFLE